MLTAHAFWSTAKKPPHGGRPATTWTSPCKATLPPPIVTDVGGICRTDVYCVYCAIADLLFQRQKLQKRHSVHKSNINALCGSCTRQSHGNINLKHPSRLEAHPLESHLVQVSVVKRLSCILLQLQKRLWKKGSLFTNGQA